MDFTIGVLLFVQVRPIRHEAQTRQEENTVLDTCTLVGREMEGKAAWLSTRNMICKLQSLGVTMRCYPPCENALVCHNLYPIALYNNKSHPESAYPWPNFQIAVRKSLSSLGSH